MDDLAPLPAVEIETANGPDAVVVFLHGLGDDGHGWSDVVPALGLPSTLRVRFLFPHAPDMPVTINGGYVMPAWYDVLDADFRSRADLDGVRQSSEQLKGLIARERPGSARLQRAGRRIMRRRTSGKAHFIILGPDPRIVFILSGNSGVPGISEDIMKLFRQVAIRSNVAVERFFLPQPSGFLFEAIDFAGGERLQGTHQLSQ